VEWSFNGPLGKFDRAQLQRGFQVYKEVCAACHGMKHVAFHALGDEGGPEFSEAQVKALAASVQVPAEPNAQGLTYSDAGERLKRPGIVSDYMLSPFENEQAARTANAGALPPDLSLMAKAREGGPNYIYSIMTGYENPPAGFQLVEGKHYNAYFPGHNLSMPKPLNENGVTYSDGTKASVDQQAKDVAAFLMWAAEPKLEARKHIGTGVMIFLLGLSTLLFLAYRKLWTGQH
jgi:ubiquinol-cytochrome c reductase cytochrome c1 subunit